MACRYAGVILAVAGLGGGPVYAAPEIPISALTVQAELSRGGDYFGFGFGALWFMSGPKLIRVDAADNSISDTFVKGATGEVRGVVFSEDAVWLADAGSQKIYKVDPISRTVTMEIFAEMYGREGSIGVGAGSVWLVTQGDRVLARFNIETGDAEPPVNLPSDISTVTFAYGAAWAAGFGNSELYRIDPVAGVITDSIPIVARPLSITACEGGIWVLGQGDHVVQHIDPKTREVVASIDTGRENGWGEISCGGGYLWFSLPGVPVAQIDPRRNELVRVFVGNDCGLSVAFGGNSLWLGGAPLLRLAPPPL